MAPRLGNRLPDLEADCFGVRKRGGDEQNVCRSGIEVDIALCERMYVERRRV